MESFEHHIPARIVFGEGSLDRSGIVLGSLGQRALIVSDQVSRDSGTLSTVEASLSNAGIQSIVYDSIPENPTNAVVGEIVRLGRAGRALVVIGVGEEDVLSTARFAAAFIPRDVEVESLFRNGGPGESLPFAAVPTRSGLSQILASLVPYVDSRDRSVGSMDLGRKTDVLVLDPTAYKDANVTVIAYLTVDLLMSVLEALCSKRNNFLTDMYVAEGLRLLSTLFNVTDKGDLGDSLPVICRAGLVRALASPGSSDGICTALSRWIAAKSRVPRIAVASVIAMRVATLLQEALPERMKIVKEVLLEPGDSDQISEIIGGFLSLTGLPLRLRELEIAKSDLLSAAYGAFDTDMVRLSSAPVTAEELHGLLQDVY